MDDRRLKILSLAFVAIGLAGLALSSMLNDYFPAKVYEINENMLGRKVVVNGTVDSSSVSGNNLFMTLEDSGLIKVVMFNSNIPPKKGSNITVYGKVNVYKNELEIVADKLIPGGS